MVFDIELARKDGFTDTQIADFLAEKHGFNAGLARQDGFSDTDIVTHLAERPFESESLLKETGKAAVRGLYGVPQMFGQLAKFVDQDTGKAITEWAEKGQEDWGMGEKAKESFVKRGILGGIESMPASVSAGLPGATAGAVIGSAGGPVGTWLGGAIGYGASGGTLMGLAEYQTYLEDYKKATGKEPDFETKSKAVLSALAEGGFEGISNLLEGLTLGAGRGVIRPTATTLKEILKAPLKTWAKRFAAIEGIESATEMATAYSEAALRKSQGIPTLEPWEAAQEAIIPALTMGGMFTLGGAGLTRLHRKNIEKTLSDPNAATPEDRQKAVDYVASLIEMEYGDLGKRDTGRVDEQGRPVFENEIANLWRQFGTERIKAGETIPFDLALDKVGLQAQVMEDGLRRTMGLKGEDIGEKTPEQQIVETEIEEATKQPEAPPVASPETTLQGEAATISEAARPGGETVTEPLKATPAPTIEEIDQKANEAATSPENNKPQPTEPQILAGNYAKGHINLQGLDISIENPKGSTRSGTNKAGQKWENEMKAHYGYIKGTKGKDKDHLDVFIGEKPESNQVFVIDQADPGTGKFDEHKIVLGATSKEEAKKLYLDNYEPGWKGLGSMTPLSMEEFKTWIKEGDTTKALKGVVPNGKEEGSAQKGAAEAGLQEGQEVAPGKEGAVAPVSSNPFLKDLSPLDLADKQHMKRVYDDLAGKEASKDVDEAKAYIESLHPEFKPKEKKRPIPNSEKKKPENPLLGGRSAVLPKKIGENVKGLPVYEDDKGVRSYIEDGVRVTEAVAMTPTKAGVVASVDKENRSDDFLTKEEAEAKKTPKKYEPPFTARELANVRSRLKIAQELGIPVGGIEEAVKNYESGEKEKIENEPTIKDTLDTLNSLIAKRERQMKEEAQTKAPEQPKAETKPAQDLSGKSLSDLVGDMFSIINDHIGTKGEIIFKGGAKIEESLYQKLKPYLQEIARRAKAKGRDIISYISGAADAMPEGKAKEIYEAAADRYAEELQEKVVDKSEQKATIEEKEAEGAETGNDREPVRKPVLEGTSGLDGGERTGEDIAAPEGTKAEGLLGQEGGAGNVPGSDINTEGKEPGGSRGDNQERPDLTNAKGEPTGNEPTPTAGGEELDGGAVSEAEPGEGTGTDRNYRIDKDDTLYHSGAISRINANVKAIGLLKRLEEENRDATDAEKKVLLQFTGWGAVAQTVFNPIYNDYVRYGKRNYPDPYRYYRFNTPAEAKKYIEWEEKWGKALHPKLGGMLTEEEWSDAEKSGTNAHYTSREVIEHGLWPIVQRLGFKKGTVADPALGNGLLMGLLPDKLAGKVKLVGVELDSITGRIAQKLYPDADIQVTGFQDAIIPDRSLDVVVSNFPFGDYPISDAAHPAYSGWSIHNYFFARSLDAVRPGGLVVAITSRYTMDSTKYANVRTYMMEKADLVGAMRLPNNAFQKNAGTEVTTDIIILRKKTADNYPVKLDWKYVKDVDINNKKVAINEYFVDHPEMVLGEHSLTGAMHAKEEYSLKPKDMPLTDLLDEAVKTLPKNIMGEGKAANSAYVGQRAEASSREGQFTLEDGKVYIVQKGLKETPSWSNDKAKVAQAVAYLAIRDKTNDYIVKMRDPTVDDDEIEKLRKDLNTAYDAYVKKHGVFHDRKSAYLSDDTEFPVALALEKAVPVVKEMTVKSGPNKGRTYLVTKYEYDKFDILTKRTVHPFTEPNTANNIEDALLLSMTYKNRVDVPYIAQVTGKTVEDARAEIVEKTLAFEDPSTGFLVPKEEYLSGNVREKLRIAREAGYVANADALLKVQPKDWSIDEIHFKIGSEWIPTKIYDSFIADVIDVPRVKVSFQTVKSGDDAASRYTMDRTAVRAYDYDHKQYTQWGYVNEENGMYIHLSALDIIEDSLNLKRAEVRLYEYDDRGNVVRSWADPDMTLLAQQKQREIQQEFRRWVMDNREVSQNLARIYNDRANSFVVRQWDVPDIAHFPNSNEEITLRESQKRGVKRGLNESTVFAHAVGTGKTFLYTTLAMELRRTGQAKKPVIVVQGSTLNQFAAQARRLYPGARILAPTKEDREKQNRNTLLSRIATGDWDMVILPHSFFDKVAVSPERERTFLSQQIADISNAVVSQGGDPRKVGGGRNASNNVKMLMKLLKKKEERLKQLLDQKQDIAMYWEDMGVDALLVDEAHYYKRGDFYTKMDNIKGLDRGAAAKSFRFLMKVRALQEKTGFKNVYLATGTPVSNTIAELWTLLRYVRPDILRDYGVEQFDSFATTFGDTVVDWEKTETGDYKQVERFNRYVNGRNLINMWLSAADVILQEDVPGWKDNVPALRGGAIKSVTLPRSEELAQYIKEVKAARDAWNELGGKEKMRLTHIPLELFGMARLAAIDLRLVKPGAKDDPDSKANFVVNETYRRWVDTGEIQGTQLIFSDSIMGRTGFNLYEDIKAKLIKKGIPEEQIAIITDNKYGNDTAKEALFEKVNAGAVRVVIGSTQKLGIGVNVQEKLIAIHHIDAPLRPMDFEQRNGRILRPGNPNAEVEILAYATQNTLDSVSYDRLQKKQKFINQLLRGNIEGNSFEDPADELQYTFEMLMAESEGNPFIKQRFELEGRLRELEILKNGFIQKKGQLRTKEGELEDAIAKYEKDIVESEEHAVAMGKEFPKGKDFAVVVNGKAYAIEKEGIDALQQVFYEKRDIIEKRTKAELEELAKEVEGEKLRGKDIYTRLKRITDGAGRLDLKLTINGRETYGQFEQKHTHSIYSIDKAHGEAKRPRDFKLVADAIREMEVEVKFRLSVGDIDDLKTTYYKTASHLFEQIRERLSYIQGKPDYWRGRLEETQKNLKDIRQELTRTFDKDDEIADIKRQYERVLAELAQIRSETEGLDIDDETIADMWGMNKPPKPPKKNQQAPKFPPPSKAEVLQWLAHIRADREAEAERAREKRETAEREAADREKLGLFSASRMTRFSDQYSVTDRQASPPLFTNLEMVKEAFRNIKGVTITNQADGIHVDTDGYHMVLKEVPEILPDLTRFKFSYGREIKGTERIAGAYNKGEIRLVKGVGNAWTVSHESVHWFEDLGILKAGDIRALKEHIKKLVEKGEFTTANKDDVGGSEDRANFLADQLLREQPKSLWGKAIEKVRDFIDALLNSFGIKTVRGVVRGIETGKAFEQGSMGIPMDQEEYNVIDIAPTNREARIQAAVDAMRRYRQRYLADKGVTSQIQLTIDQLEEMAKGEREVRDAVIKRSIELEIAKEKREREQYSVIDTNTDRALNPEQSYQSDKSFKERLKASIGPDINWFVKWFYNPFFKGQKIPEWKKAVQISEARRETRTKNNHRYFSGIKDFFNLQGDSLKRVEKVLVEGDATLPYIHADLLKRAAQAKRGGNLEEAKALREKANALRALNRYSDQELRDGITLEGTGERVRLSDKEIEVYRSLRKTFDGMHKDWYRNQMNLLLKPYEGQAWVKPFQQIFEGRDTNKEMNDLWKALQRFIDDKYRGKKETTLQRKRDADRELLEKHIADTTGTTEGVAGSFKEMVDAFRTHRRTMNEIRKARNRLGKWIAYFPRVRGKGKYFLNVFELTTEERDGKEVTRKTLVYNTTFKNASEGEEIERKILTDPEFRDRRLTTEMGKVTKESEQSFVGASDMNLQRLLDNAIERVRYARDVSPDDLKNIKNSMVASIANELKERGFARHAIRRRWTLIKGYETEGLQSIVRDYVTGFTGMSTKQEAAIDFLQLLKTVPRKSVNLYEDLSRYAKDMLRNQELADRVSGKARGFAFLWYLGANIRPMVLQLTQNYVTGMPFLGEKMREWGVKGVPEALYHKAMADAARARVNTTTGAVKGKLPAIEKRMLQEMLTKGVAEDQYVQEITGRMRSKVGRGYDRLLYVLSYPFSQMEVFNRKSAALAMFRIAYNHFSNIQNEEERYQKAFDAAREYVYQTHYLMGKENLPRIATGGDVVGVGARTALTFRSFTHNYVLSLINSGNWKTIAHSMAYMALFGGLLGLPFLKDIFELIEKWTGYSPLKAANETMRKYGGRTLQVMGTHGLPALAGANISGSMAIGIPFIGEAPVDTVYGVFGGLLKKGELAAGAAQRGDYYRAVENLAPEFVGNPMKALRMSETGKELGLPGIATTPRGKPLFGENNKPISLSASEAALKTIGINPAEYSGKTEAARSISNVKEYFREWHDDIGDTYKIARLNNDRQATAKVLRDIREYNQAIRDRGAQLLVRPIKLSNVVKQAQQKPTREQRRESLYKKSYLGT